MNSSIRNRLRIIIYLLAGVLIALLLRLYFLQVISGEVFAETAAESISRKTSIIAPRGNIYDRNGKLLVKSVPVAAVAVQPHILLQDEVALELLARYLNIPQDTIRDKLESANISYLERVFLKTGIDKPTVIKLKENTSRLPGVEVLDIYLREYEYSVLASHILGYTGEIDEERLESGLYSGDYSGGDQIGLTGLEEQYENELRGQKGEIVYEVDPLGRPVSIIEERNAVGGNDAAGPDRRGIGVEPSARGVPVGFNLVGHGRDFVTHMHGPTGVGRDGARSITSLRPNVKIQPQVILGLDGFPPDRVV